MAINPTAPLPGVDLTGFTSASFNTASDSAPNANSVQWAITGTTGTHPAALREHTVSDPFTFTFERPAQFRLAPTVPTSGVLGSVPRNVYKVRTRKGMIPVVDQAPQTGMIESKISIPAGCETVDIENVRGMLSAHIGLLVDQIEKLSTLAQQGIL